ncbi:lipopolysaccharide biosynthesis protein [Alkalibacillus silvisoli]
MNIEKKFKSKFIKNVFLVASGTAMAQVITFLLLPIITRIYGPEAYGVMGAFLATINVFIPIAALTLPIAIVLPKEKEESFGIIKTSLKILILISTVLLLAILLFRDIIINLANLGELGNYLLFIPLAVFLAGLSQILRQWLIRNNTFNIIASATVYQALISHGSMVLIGFIYPIATVLILFTVLKQGIVAVFIYFKIKRKNKDLSIELTQSSLTFKEVIKKYYDFPKYRAPETFLNAVSQSLPILFIASFFGAAAAGFYTLSRSVLQVPVNLLGKSVGEVFYPRISSAAHNGENLTRLIKKATFLLALVGIIPFGIIIAFGPHLFAIIFGDEWYNAGQYAQWIALWTYFGFMNKPSVKSFPVLNAQRLHLIISIVMLVVRVGVLVIGFVILEDDILTVALLGITGAILNLILIFIAVSLSMRFDHGQLKVRG